MEGYRILDSLFDQLKDINNNESDFHSYRRNVVDTVSEIQSFAIKNKTCYKMLLECLLDMKYYQSQIKKSNKW